MRERRRPLLSSSSCSGRRSGVVTRTMKITGAETNRRTTSTTRDVYEEIIAVGALLRVTTSGHSVNGQRLNSLSALSRMNSLDGQRGMINH